MKLTRSIFLCALLAAAAFFSSVYADTAVIPRPLRVEASANAPALAYDGTRQTVKADTSATAQEAAQFLNTEAIAWPATYLLNNPELGKEAYILKITQAGVEIAAADYAGFFNASRTLAQLVRNAKGGPLPAMTIEDAPRFHWRGAMLDVARHYFSMEFLYNLVDQLADLKVNVLHLHLTDDQGWRMEIKAYPKLTDVGAWRNDIGWHLEKESSTHYREDGKYGGFYTQAQLKELVAYAAKRNITIMPEFDVPGHSRVAVENYPELIKCQIDGYSNVYCPAKEGSYEFVENVLKEIFDVFPSKYVMIGADEVSLNAWKKCPHCQALMKEKGFTDERQLQYLFADRVATFCRENGRIPTGWDEIIDGNDVVPEVAVITRFSDSDGVGTKVTGQNRELIMAKTAYSYFDYSQGPNGEPRAIGMTDTWERAYNLNPIPANIPEDKREFVIGTDGALWTEFIPNEGHAAYMLFPRMIAQAEISWTAQDRKNIGDFRRRLNGYLPSMDARGMSYRPDGGLLKIEEAGGKIAISTPVPDARIYYTTDGSYPSTQSTLYTGPFAADGLVNVRVLVIGAQGNEFPVLGRTLGQGKVSISAPAFAGEHAPARMCDDDINTYYQSKGPFTPEDAIVVAFEKPLEISGIRVITGHGLGGGGRDYIKSGRLQISADGDTFADAATFSRGVATMKDNPSVVKALRIVADEAVVPALRIREIYLTRE